MTGRAAAAELADFAVSTAPAVIPARVRSRAALHLLDTVGCGLAAVGRRACEHVTAVAAAQGGTPQASALGETRMLPAALAALANGSRCHALDFDDTHEAGICHASAVVGPAALAMAEATGRDAGEALDAYVLGTEVALRIACAGAPGMYRRGFHPTGVCGAFGAAAASARLAGHDPGTATAALGMVGSFASGLLEYLSDGSETKPLHAGWAAQAGVQAASLASAGATGPATVVDGRFGVLAAHSAPASADAVTRDLGATWEFEGLSVKAYPACHFAHSSTWLAGEIARAEGIAPGDVAEIVAFVRPEGAPLVIEPIDRKRAPRTPYDAKFSLPFTIAHLLVHDRLDLDSFSERALGDPEVAALAGRVRGELLDRPGATRFGGGVRVVTHDGATFERFLDNVPGSPGNPFGESDVVAKLRDNARLALDETAVDEVASTVLAFGEGGRLERLASLLRTACPRPVTG